MRRTLLSAAVAVVALASTASAQRRAPASSSSDSPIEIGMDATLGFMSASGGGSSITTLDIPDGRLRVAFPVSPALSIEPSFRLSTVSGGGSSVTGYSIDVGALYHFSTDRRVNQFYVRPFLGVSGTSGSGIGSGSDMDFGVGFGLKQPLMDRLGARYEAGITHVNSTPSVNVIYLSAGLSFFTH